MNWKFKKGQCVIHPHKEYPALGVIEERGESGGYYPTYGIRWQSGEYQWAYEELLRLASPLEELALAAD